MVEWAKNRTREDSQVLYQYNKEAPNRYSVLNIASLVPRGRVFVDCSASSWEALQGEATRLGLQNVRRLESESETSLFAEDKLLAITDSLDTMRKLTRDRFIGDRKLLGFFSPDRKDSIDTLYRLYVDHSIRKVQITPSFYYGFEVFDHFFWHSEDPRGFFEVEKGRYKMFHIWNSKISDLSPNRIFSAKESIRHSTPEVKFINPPVLPYFVLPDHPLHKGY